MKKLKKFALKNIIILVLISVFSILGIIFYQIISRTSNNERKISFKFLNNENNTNTPEVLDNKDGTFTVYYYAQGGLNKSEIWEKESFKISETSLKSDAIKLNSTPDGKSLKSISPFLNCNSSDQSIFYIVLDVSKSVSDSIGQDKYMGELSTKLMDILVNENLKPGDEIRIRFLGNNNKENQNYMFVGPTIGYKYSFNSVKKTNNIELVSIFKDTNEIACSKPSVSSKAKLLDILNTEYTLKLDTPEYMTNISEVFGRISDELQIDKKNGKFKQANFIIFTDGESTDGFSGCENSKDNPECQKRFSGMSLSNNDNAYIIWVNPVYKDILKNVFNKVNVYFE